MNKSTETNIKQETKTTTNNEHTKHENVKELLYIISPVISLPWRLVAAQPSTEEPALHCRIQW
jgi:hypothetical protein